MEIISIVPVLSLFLRYVSTELREISQEDLNTFLDDFNHYVFEMISSSDTNSKMGGILAIVVLINADVCNTGTRISRYHCQDFLLIIHWIKLKIFLLSGLETT